MPPDDPRMLERRVASHYESLPGSERAVADLILEYPGDVLLYSATDLAARAGVSKAAVTRLTQRLGYTDYREMQREVRETQETGQPVYLNNSLVASPARSSEGIERHMGRDLENLRQTLQAASPSDIDKIVTQALRAPQVWVIGFRNSHFFAAYIRRQLIQVRPRVTLLPVPGQVLMEDLSHVTKDDLVIAVGLRRRPPQLAKVMKILHDEVGVPIAYITDHMAVTTRKYATWTIACQIRGVSLFDSYVGVISILNYLCSEAVAMAGETGRAQLGRIEDLMELLGEVEPRN